MDMVDDLSPPDFVCPQDMTKHDDDENPSDSATVKSESNSDDLHSSSHPLKKKRKSWGQVLPEPTTTLPPRKRAKTEEEKAQRKYERVQRNRQAAHMSRMRKQEEMDQLHSQNNKLQQACHEKDEFIARLLLENAELKQQNRTHTHSNTSHRASSPFSETDGVPSLDSASQASSTDGDVAHTPLQPSFDLRPFEIKQFDDSHSAEMCSQQWTSDLRDSPMTRETPMFVEVMV